MHKKRKELFKKFLACVILAIFSLAITPWSALHHHERNVPTEKNCGHAVHVKTSAESCLICKAHFEKNYTTTLQFYAVHLKIELIRRIFLPINNTFIEQISTSLRGPPCFS